MYICNLLKFANFEKSNSYALYVLVLENIYVIESSTYKLKTKYVETVLPTIRLHWWKLLL